MKIRLSLLAICILAVSCSTPHQPERVWIPSYVGIANTPQAREQFVTALVTVAKQPLDQIESILARRAALMKNAPFIERMDETIKTCLLCAVIFEYPKEPMAIARKHAFLEPFVLYLVVEPFPTDDVVERILPLYRESDGTFRLVGTYAGFSGAPYSADAGLEMFRYCRKNLRPRNQNPPNQSPHPTALAVTPPAGQEDAPARGRGWS